MNEKILKEIGKSEIDLSIIKIIIGYQRIGNEGLLFLCSQQLSRVICLCLGKTVDIKKTTKSQEREFFA
jgi:hypothetical protein